MNRIRIGRPGARSERPWRGGLSPAPPDNSNPGQRVWGDYQQMIAFGNKLYGVFADNGAALGKSAASTDPISTVSEYRPFEGDLDAIRFPKLDARRIADSATLVWNDQTTSDLRVANWPQGLSLHRPLQENRHADELDRWSL